jgi:pimeloyl-ACP methyl ester carboxylesterase
LRWIIVDRPHLLLLHGALGASDQLAPLAARLGDGYRVHTLDFEGHGAAPDAGRPYRIEHFDENVRDYLDAQGLTAPHVFGYSMGGYVALHLARHQPGRLGRIITLGTKLLWRADEVQRELALLDPDRIEAKVPRFAEALRRRHGAERWRQVLARTAEMMAWMGDHAPLGAADLAALHQPVRLMVGDGDTTAGVEDTVGVFRLLPGAQLAVLPGTPHPLERVDPDRLADLIMEFLETGG